MMKVDVWIISGIFSGFKSKVYFLHGIIMRFSLKSNYIQIHVAFLFFTLQLLLFQNSFDHVLRPT